MAVSQGEVKAQPPSATPINPAAVLVSNFEGWGTSLCWWAKVVGGYTNRDDYAKLAFATLKLNLVRYNIGGGENPGIDSTLPFRARAPGFQPQPGEWDWNVDANQRWMLKRAVALGANRVVAFANSPPWWMTVSGSVTGSRGGDSNNLLTGSEKAFATYLATVVSNLTVMDGVKFDFVTPVNEPLSSWWKYGGRQEGCHMSADQQARVINELRAALDAQKLAAGITASEDNDEQGTLAALKGYGAAVSNVTQIAAHTYTANNPAGLRRLAEKLRRPLWISEYGDGDASGLAMARRIREDLVGTRASAWIYWQFVDNAGGWGLLHNSLRGRGETAYTINQKFYVLGQFSQFIRPGFQLLDVNEHNSLVAYDSNNHQLVIVAVNETTNRLEVAYHLGKFAAWPASVALVCRTSPQENQANLAAIGVTNKVFSATLIPRSVTTFVLTNVVARWAP